MQYAQAQDPAYPAAPPVPQNLISAEYFYDTDPGFGAGTAITIVAGVNISNVAVSANTTGLSNGVHRFSFAPAVLMAAGASPTLQNL